MYYYEDTYIEYRKGCGASGVRERGREKGGRGREKRAALHQTLKRHTRAIVFALLTLLVQNSAHQVDAGAVSRVALGHF
jgi:hypothetical protein